MLSRRVLKTFLLTLIVFLCAVHVSHGEGVPQLINYSGTLTNTSGAPVPDGQYDVEFKIYNVPTGGTPLWTEAWNATTSKVITFSGVFNVMLGAHTSIPASFFTDNTVAYLGIKVGSDSEMLPRQRITSVAYSFVAGNGIPKGGVIMWSGAVNQIPAGWALCDGTNGTPDLRDRFIVGAGSGYAVGASGGEATHVLTVNEMPSHTHIQDAHTHTQNDHNHGITDPGHFHPIGGNNVGGSGNARIDTNRNFTMNTDSRTTGITINNATATNQNTTPTNQNTGGGAAHENRPPYYALAFIMKL